ncbi:MAG: GSU2403 family nucleotidyltransferase fold protein [Gemmatimonadaceae bacterium]
MDDRTAMARLIGAVRPWLDELVIVGGWAHQLHRLHPLAATLVHPPLRTRDAALAFAANARLDGNIAAAWRAAEFTVELSTEYTPPVSHYLLGTENGGFYAEFLAPLRGSGVKRSGEPDATIAKAGITAQKLRHLEILLTAPWIINLNRSSEIPVDPPSEIRIANAVSFVVHKLLIHRDRRPDKRPQDILYVHDTLELFGGELETLRKLWVEHVRPAMVPSRVKVFQRLRGDVFGSVTDIIREAARIPQHRRLVPGDVRRVCELGLAEIFGEG